MSREAPKTPSQKADPYRPILALGVGGMGEVRLAVAQGGFDVKKLVVLKTLRAEMRSDSSILKMFLEEACLSARLNHPNVVQVHKVVPRPNPVIVMEYLDGQPLSAIQMRAGNRLSTAMQLRILSHVLAGLHYSHELRDYDGTPLNIVHRDVSPQNVFVTYEGLVKVLDFGLAKVATKRTRTKSGTIKGKIEYMPIEQMMAGEVDRRADIHAVGCMLWHACTGERLWANESEASIIRHLMTGNIPRPSTRRPVDPRLEGIVMKALAFDPKDRYPTALAMQTAIDELLLQMPDAPSTRDTAAFVSSLFAEQRQAMTDVISAAMARRNPLATQPDLGERSSTSLWFVGQTRAILRPFSLAGVLAATIVFSGVGVWQLVTRSTNAHPKNGTTAVPSPRFITVRVSVSPPEAAVVVDNWPTHENPVTLRLPQDTVQHEIRASLSGYEPIVKPISLESDLSLELVLKKVNSGAESSTSATTGAIPSVQSGPADAPRHPRRRLQSTDEPDGTCSPPFYYKNGMKLFKPQCL